MTAEELKKEILEKTAEYFRLVHGAKAAEPFTPGKSRVNYAGRVFDEREMQNLVDASLEFWLTYGHWSRDFEKGLAAYVVSFTAPAVHSGLVKGVPPNAAVMLMDGYRKLAACFPPCEDGSWCDLVSCDRISGDREHAELTVKVRCARKGDWPRIEALIREKTPLSSLDFDLTKKVASNLIFSRETRRKKFGSVV